MTNDHDFNNAEKVMGGIMMCMPSPLIYKDDEIVVVQNKVTRLLNYQNYLSNQVIKIQQNI